MFPEDYERPLNFIIADANGGPFDVHALLAGYFCGLIDQELHMTRIVTPIKRIVPTASVPQIDLIAMRNNYYMHSTGPVEENPEWSYVILVPSNYEFRM